ncbi:MAG: hemolysin family protein, partial [Planctomycetota bacterium]
ITPSQVEILRAKGGKAGERIARLRADIEEPIAAILTINTIAHTVGATMLGSMVGDRYAEDGGNALAIFTAVFTFLVLAGTEIVPKSVGVRYASTLAPLVALPIQWMVWISYPIAKPSKMLMRLLTGGGGHAAMSEDEVLVFSKLAMKAGDVRKEEFRWVEGALLLDQATAGDLRTPRTVVFTLDADATVADVTADRDGWVHSRVPLVEGGNPDAIVGLVYRRDVLQAMIDGRGDEPLRALVEPLQFVPESMPAHELLREFIEERRHMVAVADEYGGFEGVVTLEDVVERMLGQNIVDEFDVHEDLRRVARGGASD